MCTATTALLTQNLLAYRCVVSGLLGLMSPVIYLLIVGLSILRFTNLRILFYAIMFVSLASCATGMVVGTRGWLIKVYKCVLVSVASRFLPLSLEIYFFYSLEVMEQMRPLTIAWLCLQVGVDVIISGAYHDSERT